MSRARGANQPPVESPGRFAYEGLERVIHEKARLGILTSLVAHSEGLLFADLKELCTLTDGNLNRHLKVLQDAQLVEVWKGGKHKRPQTMCRMTEMGRDRFLQYISVLEAIVSDAAASEATTLSGKNILKGLPAT